MARKKDAQQTPANAGPQLVKIEDLFAKHQVPLHVRRGVMVRERWVAGRAVTEEQFTAAVAAFRRSR
jgi:hypothetical protein